MYPILSTKTGGKAVLWLSRLDCRAIPIFIMNPAFIPVRIKLVKPKCNQKIWGLPLFFIRILVFHSYILHYADASGVVPVMGL